MLPLPVSFYNRPVYDVALDMLGKTLVFGTFRGIITETEAYAGEQDPASHAFRGKTPRASIMFGPPGITYVYLIYGMYHCLNIVTGPVEQASAVLIRGLRLPEIELNGPGKICRHLGINMAHHGLDVTGPTLYLTEGIARVDYRATPRIGIRQGQDKLWRFLLNNPV